LNSGKGAQGDARTKLHPAALSSTMPALAAEFRWCG